VVTRKSPASAPESATDRIPVGGVSAAFANLTTTEVPAPGTTAVGARVKDFEPSVATTTPLGLFPTLSAGSALPERAAVGAVVPTPGDALTVRVPALAAGVKEMGVN
jgi:hypothetical protein